MAEMNNKTMNKQIPSFIIEGSSFVFVCSGDKQTNWNLEIGSRNGSSEAPRSESWKDVPCAASARRENNIARAQKYPINTSAIAGRPMESFGSFLPKKLTHPSMGN